MNIFKGQQIITINGRKGVVVSNNFSNSKPLIVRFDAKTYETLSLNDIKG